MSFIVASSNARLSFMRALRRPYQCLTRNYFRYSITTHICGNVFIFLFCIRRVMIIVHTFLCLAQYSKNHKYKKSGTKKIDSKILLSELLLLVLVFVPDQQPNCDTFACDIVESQKHAAWDKEKAPRTQNNRETKWKTHKINLYHISKFRRRVFVVVSWQIVAKKQKKKLNNTKTKRNMLKVKVEDTIIATSCLSGRVGAFLLLLYHNSSRRPMDGIYLNPHLGSVGGGGPPPRQLVPRDLHELWSHLKKCTSISTGQGEGMGE